MLCYQFPLQCYPYWPLVLTHKSWVVPLPAPCRSNLHLTYSSTRGRPGGCSLSSLSSMCPSVKCFPLVQAVPQYLRNSIHGRSARTCSSSCFPGYARCPVPSGWQGGVEIHCFSVTRKKRDTRQLLGKNTKEIHIIANEGAVLVFCHPHWEGVSSNI